MRILILSWRECPDLEPSILHGNAEQLKLTVSMAKVYLDAVRHALCR